jgi:hypothetical protein
MRCTLPSYPPPHHFQECGLHTPTSHFPNSPPHPHITSRIPPHSPFPRKTWKHLFNSCVPFALNYGFPSYPHRMPFGSVCQHTPPHALTLLTLSSQFHSSSRLTPFPSNLTLSLAKLDKASWKMETSSMKVGIFPLSKAWDLLLPIRPSFPCFLLIQLTLLAISPHPKSSSSHWLLSSLSCLSLGCLTLVEDPRGVSWFSRLFKRPLTPSFLTILHSIVMLPNSLHPSLSLSLSLLSYCFTSFGY